MYGHQLGKFSFQILGMKGLTLISPAGVVTIMIPRKSWVSEMFDPISKLKVSCVFLSVSESLVFAQLSL